VSDHDKLGITLTDVPTGSISSVKVSHEHPVTSVSVPTYCHALRGATIAPINTADCIYAATRELLQLLVTKNDIAPNAIASAFFTVTPDLNAAFPAKAARQLGWQHVALLCATEIAVPNALGNCIRVLLHFNADQPRSQYQSIYVHGAEGLLVED